MCATKAGLGDGHGRSRLVSHQTLLARGAKPGRSTAGDGQMMEQLIRVEATGVCD